jgi:kynurenine 3-monooxygenase
MSAVRKPRNRRERRHGVEPEEVIIAGAGLAGSLLAVFLAQRGLNVTVFERRGDMRSDKVEAGRSINLALASRGIAALERAGLFERLKPILVPMPGRMLHDAQGETLYQPYSRNAWEYNWSASRAALNMALMDAAEATGKVQFVFRQRIEGYDFAAKALRFFDEVAGEELVVHAPVIIATDGAGSPLRRALCAHTSAVTREEPLGHAYKELHIPPAPGGGFRMREDALHIWPRGGHMIIALPNPDGSFTVTLFMAREGSPSFAELTSREAVAAFFAAEFPDAVPLMPTLVDDFFRNPTGMLGTIRLDKWTDSAGSLLVLGDAAHAVVPFHGQGMNAAFEDCVAVDDAIAQHGDHWQRVFRAVERARKPNSDAIADMALENYIEMRDMVRDPRFHLRKKLEFLLEGRHPRRFIARYSMVMFHPEIPYAEAQRRGAIQAGVLDELIAGVDAVEQVDLARADALVTERLPELG